MWAPSVPPFDTLTGGDVGQDSSRTQRGFDLDPVGTRVGHPFFRTLPSPPVSIRKTRRCFWAWEKSRVGQEGHNIPGFGFPRESELSLCAPDQRDESLLPTNPSTDSTRFGDKNTNVYPYGKS